MNTFWNNLFALFHTGKYLQVLLFLLGLLILKSFWNLQRNKDVQIDFVDLLIGTDGRASGSKMMQLGAFAISTWAFVYLVIKDNLSEWYYTTYMLAWSGSHIISKWLSQKDSDGTRYNARQERGGREIKPHPAADEGE